MQFIDQYSKQISGALHCYDRIVIQGAIPGICYAGGMTSYLYANKIRLFDYPKFAAPFREELQNNAEQIAENHGIKIQFIRKRTIRKEKIISDMITIISRAFTISGFQNKNLRYNFKTYSSSQILKILKRLHTHGLIKKVAHAYKYYLTRLGGQAITMGLKLKEK